MQNNNISCKQICTAYTTKLIGQLPQNLQKLVLRAGTQYISNTSQLPSTLNHIAIIECGATVQ